MGGWHLLVAVGEVPSGLLVARVPVRPLLLLDALRCQHQGPQALHTVPPYQLLPNL